MNNKAKKLSVSLLTTFVFVSFSQWLQLWTLNHHPHHHHHHHQLNSAQLSSAHCQEGRKKADQKPQKLTAQKTAKKSLAPRALSDHLLVVAVVVVVSMQRAFSAASPTNSLRLQSVCKLSSATHQIPARAATAAVFVGYGHCHHHQHTSCPQVDWLTRHDWPCCLLAWFKVQGARASGGSGDGGG